MQPKEVKRCTILHAVVGSKLNGLDIPESDTDEMGVCIEPLKHAFGLDAPFEQYVRTGPDATRDGPDLQVYGLRKFLRLSLSGNPSVISLLFVPTERMLYCDARGYQLQELAPQIVSRLAGKAFLGYIQAQRQRLVGERGQKGVNRPALVAAHGYDTKYAMHVIRLGFQGIELMQTGRLQFPLLEPNRQICKDIRAGNYDYQQVLTKAGELEAELKDCMDNYSPLPKQPNRAAVEDWMLRMYFRNWSAERSLQDVLEDNMLRQKLSKLGV